MWCLDATVSGGLARFINHSCNPNCIAQTYELPGDPRRIGIFALRRIEAGEELFYDYKARAWGAWAIWRGAVSAKWRGL